MSVVKHRDFTQSFLAATLLVAAVSGATIMAQVAGGLGPGTQPPRVVSPELSPERKVTLRIRAPKAAQVQLGGSGDIPGAGFGQATPLTKGSNDI